MAVCTFFLRGFCRYGDSCRNEHPRKSSQATQPNNRYAALNRDSPGHGSGGGKQGPTPSKDNPRLRLEKDDIRDDLTKSRPIWILSAYSPHRDARVQLFGGPSREMSFEELRSRYYELEAAGNQQLAIQEEQQLIASAEQQMQTALNDLDGAIKYILDGEKQASTEDIPSNSTSLGQKPAFGKAPAWGGESSPIQTATSTFGQPSSFGKPSVQSTFGHPPSQPTFGKPSSQSIFAQPSNQPIFGQPSSQSTFGQPSIQPTFGQPSIQPTFGQPSSQSTFGKASVVSVFGQPSVQQAFGQSSAPTTFGQPSNQLQTTGLANQHNSAFRTNPTTHPSTESIFGRPTAPSNHSNPFSTVQPAAQNPFSAATKPSNSFAPSQAPAPTQHTPSTPGNTLKNTQGKLTIWRGKPISYIADEPCFKRSDGEWEKVWFPDGMPSWTKEPDVPDGYWTEEARQQYAYAMEHGAFKDGKIPEAMPKAVWTDWNF